MAISLHQVQKQTQQLAMTPLMQQALRLLQLPSVELEQLVLEEAEQNPFLELEGEIDGEMDEETDAEQDREAPGLVSQESEDERGDSEEADAGEASSSDEDREELPVEDTESLDSEETVPALEERFDDVDVDWAELYEDSVSRSYAIHDPDEEEHDLEDYVPARETLSDRLRWQLQLMPFDERLKDIAEYIVGCLDPDGYLRVPEAEIAQDLGCSVEEVERALQLVQSLDPPGIGARNLAECLTIQLRHRRVDDPLLYAIVRQHLVDVQKKNVRKIAQALKVSEERVREAINFLATLEPAPGYAYGYEPPMEIRPDVVVKKIDDDYYVYVEDGKLAGLRISPTYRRMLEEGDKLSETDRKFALEKYKSAKWLIRNIDRRKNTLLRVAQAIVEHQREFLDKGISHLRPLTLRQIADAVGMHESTVARVTSGKYMETPRGTFEMKFFFSRGIQSDDGEGASNTTVKQMIAEMIAAEDPRRPLSDQKIVELLAKKGIHVARRTVAKYREQLGILSSRLRKKV